MTDIGEIYRYFSVETGIPVKELETKVKERKVDTENESAVRRALDEITKEYKNSPIAQTHGKPPSSTEEGKMPNAVFPKGYENQQAVYSRYKDAPMGISYYNKEGQIQKDRANAYAVIEKSRIKDNSFEGTKMVVTLSSGQKYTFMDVGKKNPYNDPNRFGFQDNTKNQFVVFNRQDGTLYQAGQIGGTQQQTQQPQTTAPAQGPGQVNAPAVNDQQLYQFYLKCCDQQLGQGYMNPDTYTNIYQPKLNSLRQNNQITQKLFEKYSRLGQQAYQNYLQRQNTSF